MLTGSFSINRSDAPPDSPVAAPAPTMSRTETPAVKREPVADAPAAIANPALPAVPAAIMEKPSPAPSVAELKRAVESSSPTETRPRFEPKPTEPEKSAPEPHVPSELETETKLVPAKTPNSTPAMTATPLVSIAAVLDAIH